MLRSQADHAAERRNEPATIDAEHVGEIASPSPRAQQVLSGHEALIHIEPADEPTRHLPNGYLSIAVGVDDLLHVATQVTQIDGGVDEMASIPTDDVCKAAA